MEEEWEYLKEQVGAGVKLQWFDSTKKTRVLCDASKEGVGVVMEQWGRGQVGSRTNEEQEVLQGGEELGHSRTRAVQRAVGG